MHKRNITHADQNHHILSSLALAHRCAEELAEAGFTVLSTQIEGRNPVVWIQSCARCEQLHGATMIRRHGRMGRETVMVANLHGCQVMWVVREGGAR